LQIEVTSKDMSNSESKSSGFDSGRQHLGNVYAKALLGVTEAAGNTEAVLSEFDAFLSEVLDRLPKFAAALASVRVPHADRERMLDAALKGKVTQQFLDFMKVVSRHGRMNCLREIKDAAQRLLDERRGRVVITVVTASPIENELQMQIASKLSNALDKQVLLRTQVNADLLGGLEIRIGDKVFDGSLRTRLDKMRQDAFSQVVERMRRNPERLVKAN